MEFGNKGTDGFHRFVVLYGFADQWNAFALGHSFSSIHLSFSSEKVVLSFENFLPKEL